MLTRAVRNVNYTKYHGRRSGSTLRCRVSEPRAWPHEVRELHEPRNARPLTKWQFPGRNEAARVSGTTIKAYHTVTISRLTGLSITRILLNEYKGRAPTCAGARTVGSNAMKVASKFLLAAALFAAWFGPATAQNAGGATGNGIGLGSSAPSSKASRVSQRPSGQHRSVCLTDRGIVCTVTSSTLILPDAMCHCGSFPGATLSTER